MATCTVTGKAYIGKTMQPLKRRSMTHVSKAKHGSALIFHCAIRKYGPESFVWKVLFESSAEYDINSIEIFSIHQYNTVSPNGYNLTLGGTGGTPTDETIQKMKESQIGKKHPSRQKATPETIEKLRLSHLGKKQSPETIEKRRKKLLGQKRPNAKRGYKRSSNGLLGKKRGPMKQETRDKISIAHLGKKKPAEQCARQREIMLKRWENIRNAKLNIA